MKKIIALLLISLVAALILRYAFIVTVLGTMTKVEGDHVTVQIQGGGLETFRTTPSFQ